ncbi:MAG: hypothetical protein ACO1SV_04380 [Fimbriimonas sp.]
MRTSMESLLTAAIDYAGQFPPARLGLEEALANYQRFHRGPERWILGRFVCGADRLEALTRALPQGGGEFEVAVIASGVPTDRASWEATLERDVASLNAFLESAPDYADVATYEIRLPDVKEIAGYMRDVNGLRDLEVYLEIPPQEDFNEALAALAETEWLQAKLRTGGADANAFPDAWTLAGFVLSAVDLDVPFKLTAGLHDPLPTWDEALRATHHGFLNVFGGAAVARANDLSRREFERILTDSDPAAWTFEDDGLAWRGHEASLEDIEETRAVLRAFGSCSVEEPLEGLKSLGLLGPSPS